MIVEVRRSCKKQGRWWLVTVGGFEIHRETKAKGARRFAKTFRKIMARLGEKAPEAAAFMVATNKWGELDDPTWGDEPDPYRSYDEYRESEPLEVM